MQRRRNGQRARAVRRGTILIAAGALALSACGPDQTEVPEGQEPQPAEQQEQNTDEQATDEGQEQPASDAGGAEETGGSPMATAQVMDPDGNEVGTAEFMQGDTGTEISVDLMGLEPGHHGFHIHEIGECEPDSAAPDDPSDTGDFMSAGGHIADDMDHPQHPGDLPSLLVMEDGSAQMSFTTDRLTEEHLMDDDGAALMVHSDADNFANIPERYAPDGPDQDTLDTGDAGDRAACGVIEASGG